jgi:aspartate aminotransferase-like enzyme
MFEQKRFLMIPGPTPVPESCLIELAKHPLPHRSKEFSEIFIKCNEGLKNIAKTKEAVPFIYASSGTGVMEATLVNILSPKDKVIAIINGIFSKRWADMAEIFGAEVIRIEVKAGQAVDISEVKNILEKHKDTKLLLATYSETSTGVKTHIKDIAKLTKNTEIIFTVDAITGLGAMPLYMDDWGVDIVLSGSQKGFMIPPGLGFLLASKKAINKSKDSKLPKYYWDWNLALKALENDTTAFTPNVSLICSLYESLKLMQNEGIENIWKRHELLKNLTRVSVKSMGLNLLVEDSNASSAITSILPPKNIKVKDLRAKLKNTWKIIIADGQKELQGKIFRMGHLGFVFERDILTALSALALSLEDLNFKVNNSWQEAYKKVLNENKK